MTVGDALRRAIVATPDDDTPRLIYADWLDENEQPDRAAFIRSQVEAAHAEPLSPEARTAAAHADTLLARHRYDWTRHLSTRVHECGFARGFIEHVTLGLTRFTEVIDDILDAEPIRSITIVRSQSVEDLDPMPTGPFPLAPLFAVPRLRQITRLDISNNGLFPEEAYALSDCPHLVGLKELALRANPLSPSWVEDLIAGVYFPNLTALDLADIPHLAPAVVRGLTAADHWRFTRLDLSGIVFTSDQLQQILGRPSVSWVEELRLGWSGGPNRPGPLTHLDMGWLLPWQNLRRLDLSGQQVGSQGVREIAHKAEAAKLRSLGLASNEIGLEGVRLLLESPYLDLFHLDVRANGLEADDVGELRVRFPDAVVLA